ncbi:MAG: hypothetical protein ISR76_02725 [Planctomycetes bacterium]|nr:hypothetical protein [Planctomycetota bacterium]
MLPTLSFALAVCLTVPFPHIPHAVVRDLAIAPAAGGGHEMVVCMSDETRVLHSYDEGLSWLPLAGGGLDRFEPTRVEYWPHATDPRFLIGTEGGVFCYRPATGEVLAMSQGLAADARFITEISAAKNGVGTAVLSTASGRVYAWNETAGQWDSLLDTRLEDPISNVAIAPDFDPAGPTGPGQAIFATFRGMLAQTDDGGATWSLNGQFSTPSTSEFDFWIMDIVCASDFQTSGEVVLSRARLAKGIPSGQKGQIWRSADAGASFGLSLAAEAGFSSLEATPAGPSGKSYLLAATASYPDGMNPALVAGTSLFGILRSEDGGLTWSDFGNYQDFFLRNADWSVSGSWFFYLGFAVSPDFASDGKLFFGRSSSMFRSQDEGLHWRTVRSRESDFLRSFGLGTEPGGDLVAFGASYGGGTLRANVTAGTSEAIHDNVLSFQRDIEVSPSFQDDGMVIIGGAQGNALWFDPAVPTNNTFNVSGWLQSGLGGTREVALSPRFHANLSVPGSDQTVIWFSQEYLTLSPSIYRTLDLGRSVDDISFQTNGAPMNPVTTFEFAPTYDAGSAAGRTDVYTCALNGGVFRLMDTRWQQIHQFPGPVTDFAVDPSFSRPGNPRVFAAFRGAPELAEIIDDPAGAIVNELDFPGLEGSLTSIALHPDFANQPVIYGSVWGNGVRKLDLSSASPTWVPVGGSFPPSWVTRVELAPGFPADNRVVASTQHGIVHGTDVPGAAWTQVPSEILIDDVDLGWLSFEPGNPLAPQPDRAFPWAVVKYNEAISLFGITLFGRELRYTEYDGSSLEWEGYGKKFRLKTFTTNAAGSIDFEAYDYWTGALLGANSVDLRTLGLGGQVEHALDLGQRSAVRLKISVHLDPGEFFAYDGMIIEP